MGVEGAALSEAVAKVDKSGQRVRKMFSEIAPRYDLMNHVLSLNIDRLWRRRAVREISIRNTAIVLDVCTGTGDLAISLAYKVAGKAPVIGTDFCGEMLEVARQKQSKLGYRDESLRFIEADTQSLPIESESCQCVTVAFGIRNVSDTHQGIREMMRVLQPGGQLLILEFSKPTLPILSQLYSSYFKYVLPRIGQGFAKNSESAYAYLPASVQEFPSGNVFVKQLEGLGLKEVRWIPMTLGVASIYVGVK